MRGGPADEAALLADMLRPSAPAPTPAAAPPVEPVRAVPGIGRVAGVVAASLIALLALGFGIGTIGESWSPAVQTATMSGVMIALAFATAALAGARISGAGQRPLRWGALGAATGVGSVAWCALALSIGGRLPATAEPAGWMALWGAAVTLVQVAGEEALFRGAIQSAIGRVAPRLAAITVTAALFACLHLPGAWRSPVSALNILLAGCWLGLLAERSGGLAAPLAAHWGWNAAELNGLGLYPNPGVGPWGALWSHDIIGSPLWGGGEEGLNASFLATLVLAAMTAALLAPRGRA